MQVQKQTTWPDTFKKTFFNDVAEENSSNNILYNESLTKMWTSKVVSFKLAVRGFHVYRNCWNPQRNEVLNCFHESNNPFDMFAIQVCKIQTNKMVGHLPMEISRITEFLIDRGAVFQAKLTSTYYRRSPLVRGGLEIPCEITVGMNKNASNNALLERYDNLLNDLYLEPVTD